MGADNFEWIPTAEKVQDERGYYLACNGRGEVFISDYIPRHGKLPAIWWNVTNGLGNAERVVAWAILPEPYKEAE